MGLTDAQSRALRRLQNRPTLYELEVVAPDGRRALVAYVSARSGTGVRHATVVRGEHVMRFLSAPAGAEIVAQKRSAVCHHDVTGGGIVRFTGRTKRDVILDQNPLTYVGDL